MKPIHGINERLSVDKDNDKMYLANNSVVEKISNDGKIAVGLFPQESVIKSDTLKVYNFDTLFHYSLQKNMPLIGIVEWPYFDKNDNKIYEIPDNIVDKVIDAGGMPVGIFPTQIADFQNTKLKEMPFLTDSEMDDIKTVVDICDGILMPGTLKAYEYMRFIHEYTLIKNSPYLGICGGMQIMTYPKGQDYFNSWNNKVSDIDKHKSRDSYGHNVIINPNTKLSSIIKKDEIAVNSYHSYEVGNTNGYAISAVSDDGVIEAIEDPNKLYQIGVQWHPEKVDDENTKALFDSFVDAADEYSKRK